MKDFNDIYGGLKYRKRPWVQLRSEEMNYIVFRAYLLNYLKKDDVKDFIKLHKLALMFKYLSVPLVLYSCWTLAGLRGNTARVWNRASQVGLTLTASFPAWYFLNEYNPFRASFNTERDKVLRYLDTNMGFHLLELNTVLPRWWTEDKVARMTANTFCERNSLFTGIFYDYPERIQDRVGEAYSSPKLGGL